MCPRFVIIDSLHRMLPLMAFVEWFVANMCRGRRERPAVMFPLPECIPHEARVYCEWEPTHRVGHAHRGSQDFRVATKRSSTHLIGVDPTNYSSFPTTDCDNIVAFFCCWARSSPNSWLTGSSFAITRWEWKQTRSCVFSADTFKSVRFVGDFVVLWRSIS